MLIGIDASRANRDKKTGTEYYAYHLIRSLAKIDKKNKYILYTDKPLVGGLLDMTRDHNFDKDKKIVIDKKGYQQIASPYGNFQAKILNWPFNFLWTLGRLSWEMLVDKPDVLFVPSHTLPLVLPRKTVNTIHDVAFAREEMIYEEKRLGPVGYVWKKIFNFFIYIFTRGKYKATSRDYLWWSTIYALKRAKKIITISQFTKNEITDVFAVEAGKIEVILNGFNQPMICRRGSIDPGHACLSKYGVEKPFLLYVGRLEKKKNTLALIEAFAQAIKKNPDIKEDLVLIGKASYGYDDINFAIHDNDLEGRVIIPGWVEEADLSCFYRAATAFVFPSKHEGFGIPVLESMACDTPVLASDIPPLREVAGEAAVFFDPDSVDSMSNAIVTMIRDEELRKKLRRLGRSRILSFSWDKCAAETLALINSL
jgi:glycosyltransferase involved in cell wall biosynthesis